MAPRPGESARGVPPRELYTLQPQPSNWHEKLVYRSSKRNRVDNQPTWPSRWTYRRGSRSGLHRREVTRSINITVDILTFFFYASAAFLPGDCGVTRQSFSLLCCWCKSDYRDYRWCRNRQGVQRCRTQTHSHPSDIRSQTPSPDNPSYFQTRCSDACLLTRQAN
jgi:hypothetical protein